MKDLAGAILILLGACFLAIFLAISIWWGICIFIFSLSFGIELFFNHGLIDALFKCWELGKTISDSM